MCQRNSPGALQENSAERNKKITHRSEDVLNIKCTCTMMLYNQSRVLTSWLSNSMLLYYYRLYHVIFILDIFHTTNVSSMVTRGNVNKERNGNYGVLGYFCAHYLYSPGCSRVIPGVTLMLKSKSKVRIQVSVTHTLKNWSMSSCVWPLIRNDNFTFTNTPISTSIARKPRMYLGWYILRMYSLSMGHQIWA